MSRTVIRTSLRAAALLFVGLALMSVLLGPRGNETTRSTVGGFTFVQAAGASNGEPAVPDQAARDAAVTAAMTRQAGLNGLQVATSRYVPGLLRAANVAGDLRFTQGQATNSYVVELVGPGANGWQHFKGVVVVNADTGSIEATSLVLYN